MFYTAREEEGGTALRLMFCTSELSINIPFGTWECMGGAPARQSSEYFCNILKSKSTFLNTYNLHFNAAYIVIVLGGQRLFMHQFDI